MWRVSSRMQRPRQERARRRRRGATERPRRGTFLLYFLMYVMICEEVAEVLASRDLYETLGVARDADSATIRKAYRRLAIKYHPDKNPGDKTAEKMYVELNNAYEVLSDSDKRQRYDMTGQFGGGSGDGDDDAWDPWGIFRPGRARPEREEKRVADLVVPFAVDLETLYSGAVVDVVHRRQILCHSWDDCEKTCSHCGGAGMVIQTRRLGPGFVQQIQSACPVCGGSGKVGVSNCRSCPNGQFEKEEQTLMLSIERGAPDGFRISEGLTDELPDHSPGSVHFELHTRAHERFHRAGDDLHVEQHISLVEALVGVNRTVKQLDGRRVPIVTDKVIAPNEEIRIKGEGMPKLGEDAAGDMVVKFWVEFPSTLTEEQRELAVRMLGDVPKFDDAVDDDDDDDDDEKQEL